MQGRDFILCEHEHAIARKAMFIANQYGKTNNLSGQFIFQKAMELFHLLVFLKVADDSISQPTKILPHEPLDAIIQFKPGDSEFWCGTIGVEITTCFGAHEVPIKNSSKKKFFPGGHPEIDDAVRSILKNEMKQAGSIKLPETQFFCKQFLNEIADKQSSKYEFNGIDKKILLIVTGEPSDAGCPITGSWFEKSFKSEDLAIKDSFDRICVLNYFSSGKDNGPTIVLNLLEDGRAKVL